MVALEILFSPLFYHIVIIGAAEEPKHVSRDEFVAVLTIIWIFASIDTVRMRLLSDVEILRKIREQDSL